MSQWNKILVTPIDSIKQTMKVIDEGRVKIAFVVDSEKRIVGAVTDGDIRRGLLKGIDVMSPVEGIMNKSPIVVKKGASAKIIKELFNRHHIQQIPIVNDTNEFVGLELLNDIKTPSAEKKNVVVIMAGGLGSRLMPLTNTIPKPMIPVGDRPILETILTRFVEEGFRNFFFSVNYKKEMIEDYFKDGSAWNANIQYLREHEKTGTAGSLNLLPERPDLPFFVMNGDVLTKVRFEQILEFHLSQRATATMAVREYDFQVPYGVVDVDQTTITRIDEKPVHKFFVNAGIYCLNPEVLDAIPRSGVSDMPTIFGNLRKSDHKCTAFPVCEYWLDIGQRDDLARANSEYHSEFRGLQSP
jgi:dTDP-glucose pyrophosphorylase